MCETNKAKLLSPVYAYTESRAATPFVFFVVGIKIPTNIAYYYVWRWLNLDFIWQFSVTVCGMFARKYSSIRYQTTFSRINRYTIYLAIIFRSMRSTQKRAHEPNDWQLISPQTFFV